MQTLHAWSEQFGSLFFSWLGPYPFIIVSEPNIAQDIFTSADCVNKSLVYKAVDDGAGKGLFGLKSIQWDRTIRLRMKL